jgi:GNAT superfamily N-acetyltransferase
MTGPAGQIRHRHDAAVRIEPLPGPLYDAAVQLWHDSGLTRPWNDPEADLRRAAHGESSAVLAVIGDDDGLLATAMVGHDGHRGWVYYLAVDTPVRGRGLGRQMMEACEAWVRSRESRRSSSWSVRRTRPPEVVLGRRLDG